MRIHPRFVLPALVACAVAGCAAPQSAPAPFEPVVSTLELMQSSMDHAAEAYWDAVSIIVDENGITEHQPETDEEWDLVWAAAVTLAESGNLLLMEPRVVNEGEWLQWSRALIERGTQAVAAAKSRDPEQVLEAGEQVYYVCLGCHQRYMANAR